MSPPLLHIDYKVYMSGILEQDQISNVVSLKYPGNTGVLDRVFTTRFCEPDCKFKFIDFKTHDKILQHPIVMTELGIVKWISRFH